MAVLANASPFAINLARRHLRPLPPCSRKTLYTIPSNWSSGARLKRIRLFLCSSSTVDISIDGYYNDESLPRFPRIHIRDPYKLLGVTPDASEEEIRGARNFLREQYAGHERSEEAIEAAYEKIIMKSFRHRKKSKFNLKTRLNKQVEESPSWVKTLLGYLELPPQDIIFRRLFLFIFIGAWSIMNSADSGPAFQVALALMSCIYFLNQKMKSLPRASLTGLGALVAGWIVGSILIPLLPPVVIPYTWSLELLTSLIAYVFLFLACTFVK